MNPLTIFKNEQKAIARRIRELKTHRPLANRGDYDINELDWDIRSLSQEFRHRHIAYCEVRGRTRAQIEQPAENNKPNNGLVKSIKANLLNDLEGWANEREQNVRVA